MRTYKDKEELKAEISKGFEKYIEINGYDCSVADGSCHSYFYISCIKQGYVDRKDFK